MAGIDEKKNAALLRPSIASSVYGNNPSLWGTGYATDGLHSFIKDTDIFASEWEIAPWIMITLDEPLQISFVRVYNREDSLGKLCSRHVLKIFITPLFFEIYRQLFVIKNHCRTYF